MVPGLASQCLERGTALLPRNTSQIHAWQVMAQHESQGYRSWRPQDGCSGTWGLFRDSSAVTCLWLRVRFWSSPEVIRMQGTHMCKPGLPSAPSPAPVCKALITNWFLSTCQNHVAQNSEAAGWGPSCLPGLAGPSFPPRFSSLFLHTHCQPRKPEKKCPESS